MKRLIIDTNAWMAIAEFKLDIFAALERDLDFSYKIGVLQGTINELRQIASEQKGKYKQAALLTVGIIEAKRVPVIPGLGEVDKKLIECSRDGDLILTQDIALKKKLKKPYLTIRQKKRILMVE